MLISFCKISLIKKSIKIRLRRLVRVRKSRKKRLKPLLSLFNRNLIILNKKKLKLLRSEDKSKADPN